MRDPDGLLARAGVSGNPDRDQHFLVDDRVLDRLPDHLDPAAADSGQIEHVLEIGAGTGALTDRLLERFDRVTAIERDPTLATFLREEFADAIEAGRLDLIEGDALAVEYPDFDASISNLPYGASSEFLFRLLPTGKPLVLTVQLEFAERLAAEPGTPEYGRLTVSAGHYADVDLVEPVPPEAFSPPPAVESAIVRATPRTPTYDVADDEFFLRFVKAVFTQRRKTMRNAIRNTAHISDLDDPDAVVAAADEDLMSARAGELPPERFAELASLALAEGVA
ncbi:16S ribosomal RNA methyltransferase KsgA/Dim1 family protein [Salinarchaeum sp. Harcht-Bsk1]|uniref:16S ribosomal RNA methyltransferase A n=1 Tax=Salinarchaeum sp. Harcht-Bsk1 TaxID=1333523 RepID=UPI0003423ACE|nr:16S ribosomal RNA methyltransferase A [Salinarchaeum sp. Harcht-Bsk1]AGN00232.1 16S ribosomal RNA methyltransferase KsgA/Dim1 family protein [Salinarchaeum sp. Harcht-Bsk1]